MSKHTPVHSVVHAPVPELDLKQLQGDSARMAPHWTAPRTAAPLPVPPSDIHGVVVPRTSARMLDAMSDYGD